MKQLIALGLIMWAVVQMGSYAIDSLDNTRHNASQHFEQLDK